MGGSVIKDKRDGKFHISVYWLGKRHRIYKHPQTQEPFYSKKQAEKQLSIIRGEVDRGDFRPKAWLPDSPLSISVYALDWLTRIDASKKTKQGYKTAVTRYINPFFKDMDIRHIRYNKIVDFKKSLPLADKGKYNVVGVLKKMMNDAWKNEDISSVPPFPVLSQGDQGEIEYLEVEEQSAVLLTIPERHRPIFECGMEYGLRTQEVRAIQKDCVVDGVIAIRRKFAENVLLETTKTRDKGKRSFEITEYMQDVLDNIPQHLSPFVFVRDDGKPYTNKNLNKIWHKACKEAKIKCKLQNAFRHSLGCQMLDMGMDMHLVQDTLGHTDAKMTKRYAKRKPVKIKEALEMRRANVIKFKKEVE
ncbi:MAG: tyrosine-type recombinase/integrase [PVC group bacterium]|nr:tyrosine-type recombinase/integrase [PVC group bacterium]